jgi:hypothetical protein
MNVDYIKLEELEHNHLYRIHARNGRVGVYDENKGEFQLYRTKFHMVYTFGEIHWDLSKHFGTVKPLEELEECPLDVTDYKEDDMLAYLKSWEAEMDFQHPRETF